MNIEVQPIIGHCPNDHIVRIYWEGPRTPASREIRFGSKSAALCFAGMVHRNNAGECERQYSEGGAEWFVGRGFGGRIEVSVRKA